MRLATITLAAAVTAGFLASEALADHAGRGVAVRHGAHVTTVARRGSPGIHGYHGGYHGNVARHGYYGNATRHGAYYRPPHGRLPYGHPTIVVPPACGYPVVPNPHIYNTRRYDPHPFNSFYYRGRNFGIGVQF